MKHLDLCRIVHMGPAAKLFGVVAHGKHAHRLLVLVFKQTDRAFFIGLRQRHLAGGDGQAFADFFIDNRFNPFQIFFGDRFIMCKVKAQTRMVYIRTGLIHMGSQHIAERLVQKMGCRVILLGGISPFGVDGKGGGVIGTQCALFHFHHMQYRAAGGFFRIFYLCPAQIGPQKTGVAHLAAAFSVEGGGFGYNDSFLSGFQHGDFFVHAKHVQDGGLRYIFPVAGKAGACQLQKCFASGGFPSVLPVHAMGTRTRALFFHAGGKTVFIDAEILFREHFAGQIGREAVGVVEFERGFPGEFGASFPLQGADLFFQQAGALFDGGLEFIFFRFYNTEDQFLFFG